MQIGRRGGRRRRGAISGPGGKPTRLGIVSSECANGRADSRAATHDDGSPSIVNAGATRASGAGKSQLRERFEDSWTEGRSKQSEASVIEEKVMVAKKGTAGMRLAGDQASWRRPARTPQSQEQIGRPPLLWLRDDLSSPAVGSML